MTPRRATEHDVEAVAALDRALFADDGWSDDQVRQELVGDHRQAWVEGDPLQGYVVTMLVGDVADLQRIAVHPDHRRNGLARALLAEAVASAREGGADRMLLEVSAANSAALAFYASTGFAEISRRRRYYRDGTDAVVMQRRLDASVDSRRG